MTFVQELKCSANIGGECLRYALVWVAAVDGDIHDEERDWLADTFPERGNAIPIEKIIQGVNELNPKLDMFVLTALSHSLAVDLDGRRLIIELAIGVIRADNRIAHSELHALRFIADALKVSPQELATFYREEAGTDMPHPADLSDPAFWNRAERESRERDAEQVKQQSKANSDSRQRATQHVPTNDLKTREALATLGLVSGASLDAIRDAYRRLASVHHPDRFASLGGSAVDVSTKTFQRIKLAYEHLSRGAST